jgi:AcrR family transcriptional regulator
MATTARTPITGETRRARGGRPGRDAAAALPGRILDAAAALFLAEGYAATSIEAVALRAGVAKRTLYGRFGSKAELFQAVVLRLVEDWLRGFDGSMPQSGPLDLLLQAAAVRILDVALTRQALALRRLLVAESARLPEVAQAAQLAGVGIGVDRLAALLDPAAPDAPATRFAAGQFLAAVLSGPLNQALASGRPMPAAARAQWAEDTVRLFLRGWEGRKQGVLF